MPIKFKAIQRKNPSDLAATAKWYGLAVGDGETTLSDLANYAAETSTVTKADILAVLESTLTKVSVDLSNGKIVRVGEYFTLQMSISSEASDKEKEVVATKIKGSRITFRPGKMFRNMIKLATYEKA